MQLGQNCIQCVKGVPGYSGEGPVIFPTSSIYEGTSTVNKPSHDDQGFPLLALIGSSKTMVMGNPGLCRLGSKTLVRQQVTWGLLGSLPLRSL